MNDKEFLNYKLEALLEKSQNEIHIKVQQRNGRKSWTFIEGLEKVDIPETITQKDEIEKYITKYLEDLAKLLKKHFNCAVSVKKPENILQMSGNHKLELKQFIISKGYATEDQIKLHGF